MRGCSRPSLLVWCPLTHDSVADMDEYMSRGVIIMLGSKICHGCKAEASDRTGRAVVVILPHSGKARLFL